MELVALSTLDMLGVPDALDILPMLEGVTYIICI